MTNAQKQLRLPPAPLAMQHAYERVGLTWLDFIYPKSEQTDYLAGRFHFHPLHLEDVRSYTQRPKIDDSDEPIYCFLVLHFPVFDELRRLPVSSEVAIFVGTDYVVTSHDGHLRPLVHLVQGAAEPKAQAQLMGRGSGYLLYRIVETLVNHCFPLLQRLDQQLEQLDGRIFSGDVSAIVKELSFLRRDIISLRRIIKPNIPVINSLALRERPYLRLDEEVYYGDLTDGLGRIWDMLEEQKEIIEGLDATLSSLTSHRINQEMKTFTLISVILLPMTLFASILGMNVSIPFAEHPLALVAALLVMMGLAGVMFAFFRHKGWV